MLQNRINDIKSYAGNSGFKQIDYQEKSKMLSFSNGSVRINVYLTTGTVATCLEHPKHGKTQLFRRGVDYEKLKKIFKNPRTHTGAGYYKSPISNINHDL